MQVLNNYVQEKVVVDKQTKRYEVNKLYINFVDRCLVIEQVSIITQK